MSNLKQLISGARFNDQGTVESINIGRPGDPTQLLLYRGRIFVYNTQGQALIDGGLISGSFFEVSTVSAGKLSVGMKKFAHNLVFTAVDYNTVSWGAGLFRLADGSSFNIGAGSTGNITQKTFIYFNGTSSLQLTASFNISVSSNNILLAIIDPSIDVDGKAIISAFNNPGTTISGDVITTGRVQSVDQRTYFDLDGDRLVIFDGLFNRVVIGLISTGVYGIKVSLPGYDALTDTDVRHFSLWATSGDSENHVIIKERTRGTIAVDASDDEVFAHGLTYTPMCFVYIEDSSGVFRKLTGNLGDLSLDGYYTINDTNLTIVNRAGSEKNFKYYIFYDEVAS